jgi:hypothetical protein
VVFVAGAKLLDAVKRDQLDALPAPAAHRMIRPRARRAFSRSRPRSAPTRRAAASPSSLRRD